MGGGRLRLPPLINWQFSIKQMMRYMQKYTKLYKDGGAKIFQILLKLMVGAPHPLPYQCWINMNDEKYAKI